jgi:hypothetical protein
MEQNCLFGIEETQETGRHEHRPIMDAVGSKSNIVNAKANETKAGRGVSPRRLMEKFKANQYRCFFTGIELEREDASIDHVQPISKGGKHDESNLELVHSAINRMKGSMTAAEFIEWCVKVAVHSGGCTLPN